jgi:hypothetical protein
MQRIENSHSVRVQPDNFGVDNRGALYASRVPDNQPVSMLTRLQQLREEQHRRSRVGPRKRARRLSEQAFRKQSDALYYGTLGPASPAKRIDPKTGEVVEIISERL